MSSHLLAPALARRGIHYGWVMAALTFLVSLSSAGAMASSALRCNAKTAGRPAPSPAPWHFGSCSE